MKRYIVVIECKLGFKTVCRTDSRIYALLLKWWHRDPIAYDYLKGRPL